MISLCLTEIAVALMLVPAPTQPVTHTADAETIGRSVELAGAPLPWRLVELGNGMTAILQRDTTLPLTAIEVFVRGGARVERDGQRGFAHLLEHLLPTPRRFNANASNRSNYQALWISGNAGVERDFLRFHEEVRPEGLELALAAMADRLESDSSWYSEAALKREAEIVVNELSRAWRLDWEPAVEPRLNAGTFGPLHPYASVIGGVIEDVRSATVDDMLDWHARFFGAANMLLVVVGDFDYSSAEAMVRRHFETLRPGDRIAPGQRFVPDPQAARDAVEVAADRGAVYLRWPIPSWGTVEASELVVLAQLMTDRLTRRIRDVPGVIDAVADVSLHELAGLFNVQAYVADAGAIAAAESVLRHELQSFLADGPDQEEVSRAAARVELQFLRNLQRPVWRGGRAEALAMGFLYHGDPDRYLEHLEVLKRITAADLQRSAQEWLSREAYVLEVLPRPDRTARGGAERTAAIPVTASRPVSFPPINEMLLDNGLRVLAVERRQTPLTSLALMIFAGSTSGPSHETPRIALDALRLSRIPGSTQVLDDALAGLGADASFDIDREAVRVSVTVPSRSVGPVLHLLAAALAADVPQATWVEAARGTDDSAADGGSLIDRRSRALDCLLWDHACDAGGPLSANGRNGVMEAQEFRSRHYRPGNAALLIAGDFDAGELEAVLQQTLGGWGQTDTPGRVTGVDGTPAYQNEAAVVEQRGMAQSHILFGQVLAGGAGVDPLLGRVVGHALRERLMDNLRHEKAWIYEVWPWSLDVGSGATALHFNLPVRTDMAAPAIAEIRNEIRQLQQQPVSDAFLARVKRYTEAAMLTDGLLATEAAIGQMMTLAVAGLPLDYYTDAYRRLHALTADDLMAAASTLLDADRAVWVLTGDPHLMEAALNLAEIPIRVRLPTDN